MATPIITLDQLIAKLPTPELKAWGNQYGPSLIAQGLDAWNAAIALLLAGDTEAPLRLALAGMSAADLDADCLAFTKADGEHAQDNADKVAAQRKAAQVAATIIISFLLALVGL